MTGISAPQDQQAVDVNKNWSRVWYTFFHDVAKRINNASKVTQVTTADASDPASVIALANALKIAVNNLSAAARGEEVTP